jgi:5'-deoxynucleotidase YfbR-like HD superfamily hydrolase
MNSITTYTGIELDYEFPHPDMIFLPEIARALSREGRYANQSHKFLSVAEHSFNVSLLVPEELALIALVHDGSEAYTRDLPDPLKRLCPGFQKIEKELQDVIYSKLARIPTPEENQLIMRADKQCLRLEMAHLMSGGGENLDLSEYPMPSIRLHCLEPEKAYDLFSERYHELTER